MTNTNGGTPPAPSGSAKAIAATIAGGISTIVVYVVGQMTGKPLPPEIVAAVQTVVTGLAVWLTPHNLGSN